jgi:glycosyltransferase involved in cell wall biosynthesis
VIRVSVVVPVRDDLHRLTACLDALAAQRVTGGVEVLVVDDGSAVPVAGVLGDRPNLVVLRQSPAGSYAARNRGLRAATADVIAFTDADCVPHPDWLERALAVLDADPALDVVAGAVEVFAPDSGWDAVALHDALTAFSQREFVERHGFGATANLIARRRVFERVGPFDATLQSGGDAEWGERASAAGCRLVYRQDVRVGHPARSTLKEVVSKLRRTTRGVEEVAARRGDADPLARAVAERLLRPWRDLPRLMADPRLTDPGLRAGVAAVSVLHAALVAAETVRYRARQILGG